MADYLVAKGKFKKWPFAKDLMSIVADVDGALNVQVISTAALERAVFMVKPEHSSYAIRLALISCYNNFGNAGGWDFGLIPLSAFDDVYTAIHTNDVYPMTAIAAAGGMSIGQPIGSLENSGYATYDYFPSEVILYRAALVICNLANASAGSKNSSIQGYGKLTGVKPS